MASPFSEATALEPRGDGRFDGTVDERFWIERAPHGGYLAGLMLRALMLGLDTPSRAPRSFTTHFLAPAKRGPVAIDTSVERTGSRMSVVSARATQEDTTVAISIGAFSEPWPGLEFDHAPMPETKSPEDGYAVPIDASSPNFMQHLHFRATIGERLFSGAKEAVVGGWTRLNENDAPADAPTVAMFMDAFAPAVWPVATQFVVVPTIDLTVHFRIALPLTSAAPDDWYFGRFRSTLARDGFFEEDGELWSSDGTLIAQSRQLALALLPKQ